MFRAFAVFSNRSTFPRPILPFPNFSVRGALFMCGRAFLLFITRPMNMRDFCSINIWGGFEMTRIFATAALAIVIAPPWIGLRAAEIPPAQATGAPGSSVSVPLTLQLDDGEEVAAVQLDIQYDNKVLGVSVVLGDAARSAAKSAYLSDVLPNRKRLIIAGMNQTALASGELAKLFVSIRPDSKAGSYTLEVTGGIAAR